MWPAGTVEKLPRVNPDDGSTNVPGLYIAGDLTGVPLLKFSADSGARAVRSIAREGRAQKHVLTPDPQPLSPILDLAIVGGGVAGMAAALEAKNLGLKFIVIEAAEPFATIVNFPRAKPIYTYPAGMSPAGELRFRDEVHPKEQLLDDLRRQTAEAGIKPTIGRVERIVRQHGELVVEFSDGPQPQIANQKSQIRSRHVILAVGRSGNYRKLNVPGEDLDKVYNRLHDPKDLANQDVLVVGGGDSALETAIAIAECGGRVTLSYRKPQFSRPKSDNIEKLNRLRADPLDVEERVEKPTDPRMATAVSEYLRPFLRPGSIRLMMSSTVERITEDEVVLVTADDRQRRAIVNDAVFTMIGREPPLDLLRRSGVKIAGEWRLSSIVALLAFVLLCFWLYHWKSGHPIPLVGELPAWLNPHPATWIGALQAQLGSWASNPRNLLGVILERAKGPSFYYTLAYSLVVIVFGVLRIRRRKTPYVTVQTLTLMTIQVLPLFVLPEIILPWSAAHGAFDSGVGAWIKTTFFPGESWWRAYGLVLAWPLFVYNWFTAQPIWGWLVLGAIQTFVMIPAMIYFWGKGAYCGWICSCGALAETLGDTQRHKMPHGPAWNRLNMLGQAILAFAGILMILRIIGWTLGGDSWAARLFDLGFGGAFGYGWTVDLLLAGILGYGLYFWFSGRVWCRFACPLAALMHIYARFSRFRIFADKKKCISCNVCTSVCHQGIDIMNFANKGLPMADPECVRCSACVQMCPTGVLEFGQIDRATGDPIAKDPRWLAASPVLMRQIHVNGKKVTV